jgi:hypothetical protein
MILVGAHVPQNDTYFGYVETPPYKFPGLHHRCVSVRGYCRTLLFAISSSSVDSPVTYARLAYSLPYTLAICLTEVFSILNASFMPLVIKYVISEIKSTPDPTRHI